MTKRRLSDYFAVKHACASPSEIIRGLARPRQGTPARGRSSPSPSPSGCGKGKRSGRTGRTSTSTRGTSASARSPGAGADRAGADREGKGCVFASPTGGPLSPNTDFHVWKRLLRDAGVRDGRLHDARHTAATVLLILGVPDVVIDSITGREPGGAARMRAPCTPSRLRGKNELRRKTETDNVEGPPQAVGPFDIVPGEALAEDTRFELVRGCPQHAFQLSTWPFRSVHVGSKARSDGGRERRRTAAIVSALDKDQDNERRSVSGPPYDQGRTG